MEQAEVESQRALAGSYRELALRAPAIAGTAQPGQFVHLRVPRLEEAVLRRPFSVLGAEGENLTILYKIVGKGTQAMAQLSAGDRVSLLGPLGNGFPLDTGGAHPALVGGGYGVAPLLFLARRLAKGGTVFVGGAAAADILCADEFRAAGWDARVTTEDGSLGTRGLVTAALDAWLAERGTRRIVFYACGPDGMLRAVADRAAAAGARAWVSMDRRMGCGAGVCLACVLRVRTSDGRTSWARACRDGPVFEARTIVWDLAEAGKP